MKGRDVNDSESLMFSDGQISIQKYKRMRPNTPTKSVHGPFHDKFLRFMGGPKTRLDKPVKDEFYILLFYLQEK